MIEVLPSRLASGLQGVRVEFIDDRPVARRLLLAFLVPAVDAAMILQPVWLFSEPRGPHFPGALEDLAAEALSHPLRPAPARSASDRCSLCGAKTSRGFVAADGSPLCRTHLPEAWSSRLLEGTESGKAGRCGACGDASRLLWSCAEGRLCTPCYATRFLRPDTRCRWVLAGGAPLCQEAKADLRLFLHVWKRIAGCHRCGSRWIRLRKILVEFPKTDSPIYPIWEIRSGDRAADEEKRRLRQLEIYTRGLMKLTVECPQCGYLEREYPGPSPEVFRKGL